MRKLNVKLASLGVYSLLTVGWAACSLWMPGGFLRELITLTWLMLMPGYILWRALVGFASKRPSFNVGGYIVGLSLLFMMVLGLVLNQIYVSVGVNHPLSRIPLTIAISSSVFILSIAAAARATRIPNFLAAVKQIKFNVLAPSVIVAGSLLPLLAVAGAVTLNNGGSPGLAIVGMCSSAAFFILLLFRKRELGKYYGYALYCLCASTLLATSMRGWNITGHDVMEEYQVFQLTLTHAAWHMSYYHDAYTACLSITILPTILQKISGVYAPYIFKFVFQVVLAIIAVVLYGAMRNVKASRRMALLATFLFITFPTFLTDMAMLNRQEVGLLFFALVLHAGTNKRLSKRVKSILVFAFMVGMILSHYSTSYVAIAALLVALVAGAGWACRARLMHRTNAIQLPRYTTLVSPVVLLASCLVLIGWGAIATQTSNNIAQTMQSIAEIVNGRKANPATLVSLTTPTVSQYASQTRATRTLPNNNYYPPQIVNAYPLHAATETSEQSSHFAQSLHLTKSILQSIFNLARSAYALLIEASLSLGLLFCLYKKRFGTVIPKQYLLIGIGVMVVAALQVVLPSAINYGLTRILQQALLVLALPSILVTLGVLRLIRIPDRAREVVVGCVLVIFYLILSGAIPAITGGYKPNLTTANSGFYYSAYYTHQDEISASQWLETEPPKGSRVYTDEFMRRKLITYGGIYAQPYIVPNTIPIDSYVLLSHGDIEFNQVPAYDNGSLIYYKPPIAFLRSSKNLVYSSAGVEIYR